MSETTDDVTDQTAADAAGPWSRRRGHVHEEPLTVSWVDEKGSVVRLISTTPQVAPGSAPPPPQA